MKSNEASSAILVCASITNSSSLYCFDFCAVGHAFTELASYLDEAISCDNIWVWLSRKFADSRSAGAHVVIYGAAGMTHWFDRKID